MLRSISALLVFSLALVASAQNTTNNNNTATTRPPAANGTAPNGTAPKAPVAQPKQPRPADTLGACAKTCVRREFRSLSPQERTAYFAGIRQLMNTPAGEQPVPGRLQRRQNGPAQFDGPSEYDRLVKYHVDAQKFAHGTAYFLPWHRAYLAEFERALQRVDPSLCLVYWNWALDSQAPEQSILFTPEYLGGNGQGQDGCVQDGVFAGYRPAYPEPHCLRRQYSDGDQMGTFYSIEAVNRAVANIRDYEEFRRHVEGVLHPTPHQNFGGDMMTMNSPNDPLFWFHHTYVDYIWANWQRRNGFAFSGDVAAQFEALPAYRASDVLDSRNQCYEYSDLQDRELGDEEIVPSRPPPPKSPAPPPPKDKLPELTKVVPLPQEDDNTRYSPKDRSNLVIIRYVQPANEDWCRRNNIDVEEVRKYETDYRGMIKELNGIKGYVSQCSLLKRPKLCAGLIKKKKVENFYVDVDGVGRVEVGYQESLAAEDPYKVMANVNQRVYACSPNVERPADEYRAQVQKLTGPSAFAGASGLKEITNMDQLHASADALKQGGMTMALAAVVAGLSQVF